MKVNLKTSYENLLDQANANGICPDCHEHTSPLDSCCGSGAIVEGSTVNISLEELEEEKNNPYVSVKLLVDAPHSVCETVHRALFQAGINCNFYSNSIGDDKWSVTVFVPVNRLNQHKD